MLASRLLTGASEEIVAPEQQVVRRQPRLSDDYKRQDWLRALLQFSTSRALFWGTERKLRSHRRLKHKSIGRFASSPSR